MRSFFIFSILGQSFGIDIKCVKRILPAQYLRAVPDEDEHIEGMFQYEEKVTRVLSFRKATGHKFYAQELQELFLELKREHQEWLDALISSVEKGTRFTETTDFHTCRLGEWIDSFQAETKEMKELVKNLNFYHQRLHSSALDVLDIRDKEEAKQWIDDNLREMYKNTIYYLDKIADKSEEAAVSFQRCLILNSSESEYFGVNVDAVEDIIHIEDEKLHKPEQIQNIGEFMSLEAILEHEGRLITIVKDISVDKKS